MTLLVLAVLCLFAALLVPVAFCLLAAALEFVARFWPLLLALWLLVRCM